MESSQFEDFTFREMLFLHLDIVFIHMVVLLAPRLLRRNENQTDLQQMIALALLFIDHQRNGKMNRVSVKKVKMLDFLMLFQMDSLLNLNSFI